MFMDRIRGELVSDDFCRGRALSIAFGLTMLVLLLAGGAGAATITVNASGGAMYTRIQDAVNAASDGDTIMVAAGTYNENVVVNKSVSLIGARNQTRIFQQQHPDKQYCKFEFCLNPPHLFRQQYLDKQHHKLEYSIWNLPLLLQ